MTALRSWLRTPRLALTLLACIALSIGGTATVLTFVHAVLLRPLPFPDADRLVTIVPLQVGETDRAYLSYPNFDDLRRAARSFEQFEGATVSRLIVQTGTGTERLRGETVTPGYFDLFGVRPMPGRAFTAEEYAGTAPRAIILSNRVWQTRFGGDAGLVGRVIPTRAGPATVVGIMPATFGGIGEDEGTDHWLPERQNNHPSMLQDRGLISTLAVARLKPGVTRAQAEAELQVHVRALAAAHPEQNRQLAVRLDPFGEKWRAPLRPGLLTMLGGSLFLLLIGCGNVALLQLARLVDRERELALRLSLGAGRGDLLRLLLGESLWLALAGGILGVLLASWLTGIFLKASGLNLPAHFPVEFTAGPLVLCTGVVLLAGLVFGLLPALAALRVDAAQALRSGGRGIAGAAFGHRAGGGLIAAQAALAVTLLAGAALFLRSYDKLRHTDYGYRTSGLLRYQVSLPGESYRSPEAVATFHRHLAVDLAALPGVERFGLMGPTLPPYTGAETSLRLPGVDLGTAGGSLPVQVRYTNNAALDILGLRLREGRRFGPEDRAGGAPVGLASAALARRLSQHGPVLGRIVSIPAAPGALAPLIDVRIVGVVSDALFEGRLNRRPTQHDLLLSLEQFPQLSVGILFATTGEPRALIEPVRKTILARDATAALHWIGTMDEALDAQTVNERFWTILATAYAGTAFLLAIVGLYGVLSHGVARRRQELGVRLALGATAGNLLRLVVSQGLRLVLIGATAGLGLTLLLGRLLQARLFGISAADPLALAGSALLLLAAATLACLLPARRATQVNPMEALRAE
ncbi:MAG TPA: ADOP family duplicated permease [Lacunisphaera sp.]|nr:ADOP family duplicated permease [Lacunisphaera sp.]